MFCIASAIFCMVSDSTSPFLRASDQGASSIRSESSSIFSTFSASLSLLLLKSLLVRIGLQVLGGFLFQAAVLVEVVLLAAGGIFQFTDNAIELYA